MQSGDPCGSSARLCRLRIPGDRRVTNPFNMEQSSMALRLFVGNLAYDVTEAELRALFAAIGPLSYFSLPIDRTTGKPRGFAFAEFSEQADAEEAIRRLHNQVFQGRPLAVNEARAKDDRTTPSPPRSAVPRSTPPRPPLATAPSPTDGRNFGPDAAPRRKRKPPKGATRAERGPKRPIRKRDTGPVRFDTAEDDWDDEEASGEIFASRRPDSLNTDTE